MEKHGDSVKRNRLVLIYCRESDFFSISLIFLHFPDVENLSKYIMHNVNFSREIDDESQAKMMKTIFMLFFPILISSHFSETCLFIPILQSYFYCQNLFHLRLTIFLHTFHYLSKQKIHAPNSCESWNQS